MYEEPNDWDGQIGIPEVAAFVENWLWQAGPSAGANMGGSGADGMMSLGTGGRFAESTSQEQLTAEASEPEQSVDIDGIVDWLERLWLEDEEIRNAISEQEWQEFIDAIKASAETEN